MQLGTRWTAGTDAPAAVPAAMREAIAAVETALLAGSDGSPAPRWTLTWLEGRPIAELDTGIRVTFDDEGEVVVAHDSDDEPGAG